MSKKSKRRVKSQAMSLGDVAKGDGPIDRYRPKPGPGQRFKRELIGAETGHAKRFRNVDVTPLQAAYDRGQLAGIGEGKSAPLPSQITAEDRLNCGEKFYKWWYTKQASPSHDSTIPTISSGRQRDMSDNQEVAVRQVAYVRSRLSSRNFLIVAAFCGEGYSMLDSLRYAGVEAHPYGTAFRIREALDELVCVITGRLLVPLLVPGEAKPLDMAK